MFELKWRYRNEEYVIKVEDDSLQEELVKGLSESGYDVTAHTVKPELKLQICECSFNGKDDKLYSYVAVNLHVTEHAAVIVPVEDSYGVVTEKLAVALKVRSASLEDVRAAAASIGRRKLKRITEVA